MRKVLVISALLLCSIVNAQITHQVDILLMGADSVFYFTKSETKFSFSLGLVAEFKDITGTSGTFRFIHSPVDSLVFTMPSGGPLTVTSDTAFAIISDVTPFEFNVFKMRKIIVIVLCLCASLSFGQDGQTIDIRSVSIKASGDIHVSDASEVIALTQNIYAQVTNATNDLMTGEHLTNMTNGGDSMVVSLSGLYKIDVHMSIEGSANDIYENVIAIDNVINNDHKITRKTANNDVGDMSFSGLYQLNALQSVKIMIRNTANNNDPTVVNSCLVLFRISD